MAVINLKRAFNYLLLKNIVLGSDKVPSTLTRQQAMMKIRLSAGLIKSFL
jgi:hypothetical protein